MTYTFQSCVPCFINSTIAAHKEHLIRAYGVLTSLISLKYTRGLLRHRTLQAGVHTTPFFTILLGHCNQLHRLPKPAYRRHSSSQWTPVCHLQRRLKPHLRCVACTSQIAILARLLGRLFPTSLGGISYVLGEYPTLFGSIGAGNTISVAGTVTCVTIRSASASL